MRTPKTSLHFAVQCRGICARWVQLKTFPSAERANEFTMQERANDQHRGDLTPWNYRVVPRAARLDKRHKS